MKSSGDQVKVSGRKADLTAACASACDPLEGAALLRDHEALTAHVVGVLQERSLHGVLYPAGLSRASSTSAVLFLMGPHCDMGFEPCVLLNKRSLKVKQPGDLCFPGGRISQPLDAFLSRFLRLPFLPLGRWPYWQAWQANRGTEAKRLSLLLAASLREALEEIRLNPLGVRFLGPMPSQGLVMFRRVIYPMVGWLPRQRRFLPNWEVNRIVFVPLKRLLQPERYGLYRLQYRGYGAPGMIQDFPCFYHQDEAGSEVLWGATYRIVTVFLEMVFGFRPPEGPALRVIEGNLEKGYWHGAD
jgi:8-oxo-dGTP pyrophosphatase MutT (NUDIX family)